MTLLSFKLGQEIDKIRERLREKEEELEKDRRKSEERIAALRQQIDASTTQELN